MCGGTTLEPHALHIQTRILCRLSSGMILVEDADGQGFAAPPVMSGGPRQALFWMSGVSAIEY
jgi:hypothetical protein